MLAHLRQSLIMLVLLTVLTGAAYPLVVTVVAQLTMSHRANGSLIESGGTPVGSELIGQPFSDPKHFWSRPSATSHVCVVPYLLTRFGPCGRQAG